MENVKESVLNEKKLWFSFDMKIFFIDYEISNYYNKILIRDYDDKKNYFNKIHYLKMLKHHTFLKIYHNTIKKNLSNEKLLNYLESTLLSNEMNIKI